jgi:hypothetical protein
MRFKSIFWLFNIVVIFALIVFAVASFFLFGKDYAAVYWGNMWIVAVLFVVLIGVLDFYFIRNWTLFDLLEKEDWPELLAWLESRLYGKGQLRKHYANLLINTALSVSNLDAVKKLETEIRQRKPELLQSLGVALGIPILLEQDWPKVDAYFGPLADDPKTHKRNWARWCRALAAGGDGVSELIELLDAKDPSIRLLSLQMLEQHSELLNSDQTETLQAVRSTLQKTLAGSSGDRVLQRSREDHLMAVVLSSKVNEIRSEILAVSP